MRLIMITSQDHYKNLSYSDLVDLLAEATQKYNAAMALLQNSNIIEGYVRMVERLHTEILERMAISRLTTPY